MLNMSGIYSKFGDVVILAVSTQEQHHTRDT